MQAGTGQNADKDRYAEENVESLCQMISRLPEIVSCRKSYFKFAKKVERVPETVEQVMAQMKQGRGDDG